MLCGSGTQALQLALTMALTRAGAGATIALPAYTCYDVGSAAVGADAPLALYDIDPDTLGPDLASLERVLVAGARVVVLAPLYGVPVDWESVSNLAARFGATIVEDSAQGHGATWRGKRLGSLGGISVLSFGRGKGWTGGNGGVVLLRGEWAGCQGAVESTGSGADAKCCVALSAQWILGRPSIYGFPRYIPSLNLGVTVYHDPRPPREMTRAAAAAVLSDFEASEREASGRREIAKQYAKDVANVDAVAGIHLGADVVPGYVRFPVRLLGGRPSSACESAGGELRADIRRLGVERGYPMSLGNLEPLAKRIVNTGGGWPGAERLVAEIVTLPTHSKVTVGDCRDVAELFAVGGPFDRAI